MSKKHVTQWKTLRGDAPVGEREGGASAPHVMWMLIFKPHE